MVARREFIVLTWTMVFLYRDRCFSDYCKLILFDYVALVQVGSLLKNVKQIHCFLEPHDSEFASVDEL